VDAWGREHMILNYYVQGSKHASITPDSSESYIDSAFQWTRQKFSNFIEMSFDDIVDGTKARASRAVENSKSLFRFLSGESISSPPPPPPSYPSQESAPSEKKTESILWNLAALFVGIKGKHGSGNEDTFYGNGRTFTEGEIRADCVLVSCI
jgi:import inner membrane translocase subunit TIM21